MRQRQAKEMSIAAFVGACMSATHINQIDSYYYYLIVLFSLNKHVHCIHSRERDGLEDGDDGERRNGYGGSLCAGHLPSPCSR